ncbi:MAG: hypothetical protein NC911_03120 [Candidatus Omnitrophica bacterium]|nr:hypothetical protein [Candidatus Omnitrophota bacterium]
MITSLVFFLSARQLVFTNSFISLPILIRTGLAMDLWANLRQGRQGLVCSFFYPPLPTILFLPFVALKFHLHRFFFGYLVTSVMGGLTVFFIHKSAIRQAVPPLGRITLWIIFLLHPWCRLIFSGGNDSAFVFPLITGTLYGLLAWHQEEKVRHFTLVSLLPALALVSHPFGFILTASVFLILAFSPVSIFCLHHRRQAILLLYFFPAAYTGCLWLLGNWLIMGTWRYFLLGISGKNLFSYFLTPTEINTAYLCSLALVLAEMASFLLWGKGRNQEKFLCALAGICLFAVAVVSLLFFPKATKSLGELTYSWRQTWDQLSVDMTALSKSFPESEIMVVDFSGYLFRYILPVANQPIHLFDLARTDFVPEKQPAYLLLPSGKLTRWLPPDPFFHFYPDLLAQTPAFLLREFVTPTFNLFRLIVILPEN